MIQALLVLIVWICGVKPQCVPFNPTPDVDPWLMRVPGSGFGGITTQQDGTHKDIYLESPKSTTKIGSRLDWGGSVVFFGLSNNPSSNVIDNNDTGRELQIALYDPDRMTMPCACNASCQTHPATCPGNGIPYLGWDPVQGGDKCDNGSPINSAGKVRTDTLQVVVAPLQWNPDWQQCSCNLHSCDQLKPLPSGIVYVMEFRYITELVVEVMLEFFEFTMKEMSHNPTAQEFPTVYVAFGENGLDLPVLLSGNGSVVSIPIPSSGWGVLNFESPVPYVSFQNAAQNYGVGLLLDQGITEFQAWTGDGKNAPYFHNMRTTIEFGIPAGGTIRGLSYVGLGEFSTIQAEFNQVIASRPPFGTVDVPAPPYNIVHKVDPGTAILVAGWALDNMPGVKINIYVDGKLSLTLPINTTRTDVCLVYPEYPGCPVAGYSGLVSTTELSTSCSHLLHVVAVDAHGNNSTLGDRVFAFN